ncbi:MAG: Ig-like domain-containing protein [Candidatus Sulfotelmatobacter sp.]
MTPVSRVLGSLVLLCFSGATASQAWPQSITTYHYDNNRTGWNSNEPNLTPTNVGSSYFGLLRTVPLDDQVDSQPLYMPAMNITSGQFQGTHDVVYVATENNTVYAIDAESGVVLLNANFGTPVHQPLGCDNNAPNVGITSTPVIDPVSNTLYVMVYTQQSAGPAYLLHALDLGSLTDKVAPRLVTASQTLTNNSTFNFNAKYQRQRPALLLANSNVYAAFGSFCDYSPSLSRGWLLGWQAGTLAPLAANHVFNTQATSPKNYFLSSIWMSGFGPSSDDLGNILVVTGNSDPSGTTYDGTTNIQESVVKVSPDLSTVLDVFTPSNWGSLDQTDGDFGAGGVLVLPDQAGSYPHLAVAAGKAATMFFMNEDNLGGYSSTTNNVLGAYPVGACWCGPSYFVDPVDSLPRVVSSGGRLVKVWRLKSSPSPSLSLAASSVSIGGGQDLGFFTSVSSNGSSNPIIWALSRPTTTDLSIYLYAFNPDSGTTMKTLFKGAAGTWPNLTGNANLVPVVAKGQVLVASHNQLEIFGFTAAVTTTTLASSANPSPYGGRVSITATVHSTTTGTPTGTVTFQEGATTLGTATMSSGKATFTISTLSLGTHSITAVYSGDANFVTSGSPALVQTVIQSATSTTVTSAPNPSQFNQSVVLSAKVSSATGAIPTGKVLFKDGTSTLGTVVLTSGAATLSVSNLAVRQHSITAVYNGSPNFTTSTSAPVTQTVNKATTTTTLASTPNPSTAGSAVTFTATVLGAYGGNALANVILKDGTTTIGTSPVSATTHQATFVISTLAVGAHNITATFSGGGNFAASSSAILQQVVQ